MVAWDNGEGQEGAGRTREILASLDDLRRSGMSDLDEALYLTRAHCVYIHFGALHRVPDELAVSTLNRSYTVEVQVDRPDSCSHGVLIALGHPAAGFVFLVQENQLVLEYHYASVCYALRSDWTVPIGPSTLRFVFTKTGHLQGIGALYINNRKVGEASIPHTLPYYAAASAVVDAKSERGDLFTGTIKQVMIETVTPPAWSFNSAPHFTVLEPVRP